MQENPTIDWVTGRVTIAKNRAVYTLPCYRQCLNEPEYKDKKSFIAKEINFISAQAVQKQIQRGSSDDRVYVGWIRKVDEGTEDEAIAVLLM